MKTIRTAITNDDLNAVKTAIESDANILNEISSLGSVLQIASRECKTHIVKYLIDCQCDVNLGGGIFKKSPLAEAAFKGHLEIVKLLVQNGATLDVSSFENNPLFAAIYNNHVEVAKYLIDNGIDISASYPLGEIDQCDACEYANQYGSMEIYEYLKQKRL